MIPSDKLQKAIYEGLRQIANGVTMIAEALDVQSLATGSRRAPFVPPDPREFEPLLEYHRRVVAACEEWANGG